MMEFEIIDLRTGKYPDVKKIAMNEDWAVGLYYCDIDSFSICEDGKLILTDECGNCRVCPHERFKITITIPSLNISHSYIY